MSSVEYPPGADICHTRFDSYEYLMQGNREEKIPNEKNILCLIVIEQNEFRFYSRQQNYSSTWDNLSYKILT